VVGQSRFGPQASGYMTPFRDVFSALFFVSVGMLFNPHFVLDHPVMVLAALAIVLVVKPLVALAIVLLMPAERGSAPTVAVGLAQIGEFSFILAALGKSLGVLPPEALDALVVAAIFSIALNPVLFRALRAWERGRGDTPLAPPESELAAAEVPVVIAGAGELARRVVARCASEGIATVVLSSDLEAIDALRARGAATIYGQAHRQDVLRAAHIGQAHSLVVTDGTLPEKMGICIAARGLNPRIAIIATAANAAEHAWLTEFGVAFVCDALEGLTDSVVRSLRRTL
jgi:CPA2 family monovalent cation:H+ antiporter-2